MVHALITHCAAYVSLHRAEGLGLTMSEAMSAGRPVIATGYSGNLDFMTPDNSLLVGYRSVEIPASARPYGPPTRWAEPDLAEAVRQLRWVHEHPAEAAELGLRAQEGMRSHHDLDRSVAFVLDRVRQIEQLLTTEQPTATEPAPPTETRAARALRAGHQLLDTPLGVPRRGAARLFQRAVNRVLASHDEQVNLRLNAVLHVAGAVSEQAELRAEDVVGRLRDVRATVAQLQAVAGEQRNSIAGLQSLLTSLGAHHHALVDRTDTLSTREAEAGAESTAQTTRIDTLSELADQARLDLEGHRRQLAEVAHRLDMLAQQLPDQQAVR